MEKDERILFILTAVLILLFPLLIFLSFLKTPTGMVPATGGNVSHVDVQSQEEYYWKGFYGNISSSYPKDYALLNYSSQNITHIDLGISTCGYEELFATSSNITNLSDLVPASPSDIDDLIGVPAYSPYSGTSIFIHNHTFLIDGSNISLYSTFTYGAGVNYSLGILKKGTDIVFVTLVQKNTTSFNSRQADYQMMLPVPVAGSLNYTFQTPTCLEIDKLHPIASLADDNKSIIITWQDIGADNYSIYITDNLSAGFYYNNSNISNLTGQMWIDYNASKAKTRFYQVSGTMNNIEFIGNDTIGKVDMKIYNSTQIPGEIEFNIISFPVIPKNKSLNNVFRWSKPGDTIMTYNPFKLPDPGFDGSIRFAGPTYWSGAISEINVSKAYWLGIVSQNYTLTFVGTVPTGNISIPIYHSTQIPGEVELNSIGWNSPFKKCNLSSLLSPNSTTGDTMMIYNPAKVPDPGFDGVMKFAEPFGWTGDFDCLQPGEGLIFGITDKDYEWEYDRGP